MRGDEPYLVATRDGRQFTGTVLREAIKGTANGKPLDLMIKTGEFFETHRVEYTGGARYPHLTGQAGTPDLLSKIIAARH